MYNHEKSPSSIADSHRSRFGRCGWDSCGSR